MEVCTDLSEGMSSGLEKHTPNTPSVKETLIKHGNGTLSEDMYILGSMLVLSILNSFRKYTIRKYASAHNIHTIREYASAHNIHTIREYSTLPGSMLPIINSIRKYASAPYNQQYQEVC